MDKKRLRSAVSDLLLLAAIAGLFTNFGGARARGRPLRHGKMVRNWVCR